VYCKLEELLINASTAKNVTAPFDFVCSFYKDDLEANVLHSQLQVFDKNFHIEKSLAQIRYQQFLTLGITFKA